LEEEEEEEEEKKKKKKKKKHVILRVEFRDTITEANPTRHIPRAYASAWIPNTILRLCKGHLAAR
jgi:hypothetical protein